MTYSTNQGVVATIVCLVAGKTLFDTYNVISDTPFCAHTVNPIRAQALTRFLEGLLDSMPQALFLAIVLVQLKSENRRWIMW